MEDYVYTDRPLEAVQRPSPRPHASSGSSSGVVSTSFMSQDISYSSPVTPNRSGTEGHYSSQPLYQRSNHYYSTPGPTNPRMASSAISPSAPPARPVLEAPNKPQVPNKEVVKKPKKQGTGCFTQRGCFAALVLIGSVLIVCTAAGISAWGVHEIRQKTSQDPSIDSSGSPAGENTPMLDINVIRAISDLDDDFSRLKENVTQLVDTLWANLSGIDERFTQLISDLQADLVRLEGELSNLTSLAAPGSTTPVPTTSPPLTTTSSPVPTTSPLPVIVEIPECGPGLWRQVVLLDLNDPSQQCPSTWQEFSSPTRSCGRPTGSGPGCNELSLSVGIQYSRVCGRATGHPIFSTDALSEVENSMKTFETYVDGLSVTHSSPRQHIWTFAAGDSNLRCPCNGFDNPYTDFFGTNYFCDFARNGAVWDGDCAFETTCCSLNSPPWFSVELDTPTSDDIDVRNCTDEESSENTLIELLEVYVQ